MGRVEIVTLTVGARAKEGKGEGEGEGRKRPLPTPFDLPHLILSSGSFNMALSRAKTFARPKKTPALQASHHDTNKCIALKVSASPNLQLPKCPVRSRRICVVR